MHSELIYNADGDLKISKFVEYPNESYYNISGISYICYNDIMTCEISPENYTLDNVISASRYTVPDLEDVDFSIKDDKLISDDFFEQAIYQVEENTISFQIDNTDEEIVGSLVLKNEEVVLPY